MNIEDIVKGLVEEAFDKSRNDVLLFAALFKIKGFSIGFPNAWQDINEHWDVRVAKVLKDNFVYLKRIDVKGTKESHINKGCVLLEVRNVRGNNGWLYGRSHGIAFEREEDFIYIETEDLINLFNEKVDNWDGEKRDVKNWDNVITYKVDDPRLVYYRTINRKPSGRDDIFAYFPLSDINPLIKTIIPKDPTKEIIKL
jgi:hypothetical protein